MHSRIYLEVSRTVENNTLPDNYTEMKDDQDLQDAQDLKTSCKAMDVAVTGYNEIRRLFYIVSIIQLCKRA